MCAQETRRGTRAKHNGEVPSRKPNSRAIRARIRAAKFIIILTRSDMISSSLQEESKKTKLAVLVRENKTALAGWSFGPLAVPSSVGP